MRRSPIERDQMKQFLPYGFCIYSDGSEILFNIFGEAIWVRALRGAPAQRPDSPVVPEGYVTKRVFFSMLRAPWDNRPAARKALKEVDDYLHSEWGIIERWNPNG